MSNYPKFLSLDFCLSPPAKNLGLPEVQTCLSMAKIGAIPFNPNHSTISFLQQLLFSLAQFYCMSPEPPSPPPAETAEADRGDFHQPIPLKLTHSPIATRKKHFTVNSTENMTSPSGEICGS